MAILRGDEGRLDKHDPSYLKEVERYHAEGRTIWVQVTITRRANQTVSLTGVVPKDRLNIGTERKYGDYITELVITSDGTGLPRTGAIDPVTSSDVVFETARYLLTAIKDQCMELDNISSSFMDALGAPGDQADVTKLANIFTRALKKSLGATYNKLLTKDFTWSQIKNAGRRVGNDSPKSLQGLYSWTHSGFTHDKSQQPAVAIGSTTDLRVRHLGHNNAYGQSLKDLENGKLSRISPQYDAWRRSNTHEMVILALFDQPVSSTVLEVCELLSILLFETFHPSFHSVGLSDKTYVDLPEATEAGRTELEIETDDPAVQSTMPPTLTPAKTTRARFSSFGMKILGTKLVGLAKKVFLRTGWPGGCTRSSFAASGRNWHTPGYGNSIEGACFTKMTVPGVMDTYRKSPKQARISDDKVLAVDHIIGGVLKARFPLEEAATVGLFPGTSVHVVFEIMHRGNHAFPWARLPGVPEFADEGRENIANRLGLRLEWQYLEKSTGEAKWAKIYIQSTLINEHATYRPSRAYTQAIAIIRCLQLQVLDVYPEWWQATPKLAYIREVRFDFLNQVLTITERKAKTTIPAPVRIPTQVRMADLVARGAKNVGPRPPSSQGKMNERCDNCLLQAMDWDGNWIPGVAAVQSESVTLRRDYRCVAAQDAKEGNLILLPCRRCGEQMRLACTFTAQDQDPRSLPDELRAGLVSMKPQVSLLCSFDTMDDPGLQDMPIRSQAVATSAVLAPIRAQAVKTRAVSSTAQKVLVIDSTNFGTLGLSRSTAPDIPSAVPGPAGTIAGPRASASSTAVTSPSLAPAAPTATLDVPREARRWTDRVDTMLSRYRQATPIGTINTTLWLELLSLFVSITEIPQAGPLGQHRSQWMGRIDAVLDEGTPPTGADAITPLLASGMLTDLRDATVIAIHWVRRSRLLGTPDGAQARATLIRLERHYSNTYLMRATSGERDSVSSFVRALRKTHSGVGILYTMTFSAINLRVENRTLTVSETKRLIKAKPPADMMNQLSTWFNDIGIIFSQDTTPQRNLINTYVADTRRQVG
jgi:hypothetical protein